MGIVTPTNTAVLDFKGLHLYHAFRSNCSGRVRLLLEEKHLPWASHHLDLRNKENISEEYFGINSKGLVPTLVHDGVVIVESNDILRYLESKFPLPGFLPSTPAGTQALEKWLDLSGDIHLPGIKTFQYVKVNSHELKKTEEEVARYRRLQKHEELLTFHGKHDIAGNSFSKEDLDGAVAMLNEAFAAIERMLAGNDWMIENTYSLADISWAPTITTLNRGGFPFDSFPNLRAWYRRITERPAFESAITATHRWGNALGATPAASQPDSRHS